MVHSSTAGNGFQAGPGNDGPMRPQECLSQRRVRRRGLMKHPEGFIDNIHPNWVCGLDKIQYGLNQVTALYAELKISGLDILQSDTAAISAKIGGCTAWALAYIHDLLVISAK